MLDLTRRIEVQHQKKGGLYICVTGPKNCEYSLAGSQSAIRATANKSYADRLERRRRRRRKIRSKTKLLNYPDKILENILDPPARLKGQSRSSFHTSR